MEPDCHRRRVRSRLPPSGREERNIVMIGYRNGVEPTLPTRTDEALTEKSSLLRGDWASADPVRITRRVDLKVATIEVRTIIHRQDPER